MFTFLSVSKFTCKAISVFSLLGSRVREFKSPPPVLIRPLNKKKEKRSLKEKPQVTEISLTMKYLMKIPIIVSLYFVSLKNVLRIHDTFIACMCLANIPPP